MKSQEPALKSKAGAPAKLRLTAFTLVELLVVIFIISLLIALLLPALAAARQDADSVVCMNNERQMATALIEYQSTHFGRVFPYVFNANTGLFNTWIVPLAPYMVNSQKQTSQYSPDQIDFQKLQTVLMCPSVPAWSETQMNGAALCGGVHQSWWWNGYGQYQFMYLQCSYGFNSWLYGSGGTSQGPNYDYFVWPSTNPPAAYWPGTSGPSGLVPAFGDGIWVDGGPKENDLPPPLSYVTGATNFAGQPPSSGGDMQRWCLARHGNGINMAFWDGHVDHVEVRQLWNLNWAQGWVAQPPASVSQMP